MLSSAASYTVLVCRNREYSPPHDMSATKMSSRWNYDKPDPPEMHGDTRPATCFSPRKRRKPDPPEMMNGITHRTPSPVAPKITLAISMKFPLDFSDRPIAQRFRHVVDLQPAARIGNHENATSSPFSPDSIGSSQRHSNNGEQRQSDCALQPESNMAEKVPASHGTGTTMPGNTCHIWAKESLKPRRDSISVNDEDSMPHAEDIPVTAHISRKRQVRPSHSLGKRPIVSTKGNPSLSSGSSPRKPNNGEKQVDSSPRAMKQTTSNRTESVANGMGHTAAVRCAPLQGPGSNFFHSSMLGYTESSPLPGIKQLMNFPQYFGQSARNGKRCCIMCGNLHPFVSRRGKETRTMTIIPEKNKGVCTACDETVWKVLESDLIIKWCRICRKFCPLTHFGERGMLRTCAPCRDYGREISRKHALRIRQSTASRLC